MIINVTGKHIPVTDAIKRYAQDKVSKFPRYYDRVSEIDVVTDKHDHHAYQVEIIVHVEGHDPFIGSEHHDDLYAAIDAASAKCERQLSEYKERRRNRKHPA